MCQGCDEDAQRVASIVGVDVATVQAVRNAYRIIVEQREAEFEPIDMSGEDTADLTDVIAAVREALPNGAIVIAGGTLPDPEISVSLVKDGEGKSYISLHSIGLKDHEKVEILTAALASLTSNGNGGVTERGTIVGPPTEMPTEIKGWHS